MGKEKIDMKYYSDSQKIKTPLDANKVLGRINAEYLTTYSLVVWFGHGTSGRVYITSSQKSPHNIDWRGENATIITSLNFSDGVTCFHPVIAIALRQLFTNLSHIRHEKEEYKENIKDQITKLEEDVAELKKLI